MKAQIFAFLKGLPPLVYVVVGVLTFAASALAINNAKQRQIGALNAEIAQQEHDNRTLRMAQDSLAAIYRVDTVRLTRLKVRTDTLTNTVEQWKHDTLKVVEYVKQAVKTENACEEVKHDCEARVKVGEDGWKNARSEIAKIKALPTPNWLQRHTAASVGLGATYGQDGKVSVGPTVSFGFRFFP